MEGASPGPTHAEHASDTDEHLLQPAAEGRREGKLTWWGFCLLWLGGNWAYQSILQAQVYYSDEMPGLSFFILLTFSWPLLLCHLLNILSGAAKAAGLKRRVYAAYAINTFTGLVFIVQDLLSLDVAIRRAVVMILAGLTGASQVLLEPALFSLAALTQSSGAPTQAMMAGNAASGVIVWLASVGLRVAAGGGQPPLSVLRATAHLFFALLVLASAACAALFSALIRNELVRTSSECAGDTRIQTNTKASATSVVAAASATDGQHPVGVIACLWRAAHYVWIPAVCQFLIFWCTLASWPSIPAAAPLHGPFAQWGKDWWFLLIVGLYNIFDFIARLNLRRLQGFAALVSLRWTLFACCLRLLLVPLIYFCVCPRLITGSLANFVVLLATLVLALSNGFLATAGMMQASIAPAGLTEDGINVTSIGIYLGLAMGSTSSLLVAKYAMKLHV